MADRVSTRIPSGTRQASTHTSYVRETTAPAAIGSGNGRLDLMVAQSTPSNPMTCVANTTLPDLTAVPPVLRNCTVTFSHHR
ncbi:hypothetical protein ACGFW5_10875 [Streptomyces sp. NPDC048416]|uniref:hypothetical protein n=1 Tax=Streptomyces sp. NPDC048416 TaxID=3365546 RepID=UPI00371C82A7